MAPPEPLLSRSEEEDEDEEDEEDDDQDDDGSKDELVVVAQVDAQELREQLEPDCSDQRPDHRAAASDDFFKRLFAHRNGFHRRRRMH